MGQREAGVDDIFDNQHVASGNLAAQVLENTDLSAGFHRIAIAGGFQEVDLDGQVQFTHQIGDEDERATQQTNDHQLVGVVKMSGDFFGQLFDAGRDLLRTDERIDNIRSLLGTVSRSHAIYNNVKGEKLRSESELKAFNIFLGKKNDLKDLIAKEEETEQLKLGILKPEDESK